MVNFAEVRAQFCNFMDYTNSLYLLVLYTIFYFRSFRKSEEGFYSCHLPGQGEAGRGNAEDCSILALSPDRELKDKEY